MRTHRSELASAFALTLGLVLAGCGAVAEPDTGDDPTVSEQRRSRRDASANDADGGAQEDVYIPMDSGSMMPEDAFPTPDDAPPAPTDAAVTDGGATTITHHCPTTYPRRNLRTDYGAVGNGIADDTDALRRAAADIDAARGGELIIPPGIYRIGRQAAGALSGQPYFRPVPMFAVDGVDCLQISGYGATLRLTSGLHYGAFEATSPTPVPGPTTSATARADVGRMIEVSNGSNVLIEGLELDGNNTALSLGGQWGDVDRQTSATGLWLNRDRDVRVVDVWTHHHGLDGITVLYRGAAPPSRMQHTLDHVISDYNGRQAISWIGGWGLEAIDCEFNHTGRAVNHGGGMDDGLVLSSRPRAGLDIEPNAGTTEVSRDGQFTRCEFVDNAGAGMVAAVGNGGYSTFTDCTFWGTTTYSVWASRPGLRFVNSRFHGTVIHPSNGHTDADPAANAALATQFEGCTFEDRAWTDGRVYRNNNLLTVGTGEGEGVTWRGCTFINHQTRGVYIYDPATHENFDNCTFQSDYAALSSGSYQQLLQGSRLTSCHFTETSRLTGNYYVSVNSVTVATPPPTAPATIVDGPRVHWQSTTGRTGTIPAGTY